VFYLLTSIDTERKYLVFVVYIEYYSYQYINTLCSFEQRESEHKLDS